VAPNEMMPHMSRNHDPWAIDDGNYVMVPNPNKMISTIALVTGASTWVLEPQGVDERLNPQCGEAQHQMRVPRSFVLTNTIPNPIAVSRKMPSSIPRSKAPTSLMGVAKVMC